MQRQIAISGHMNPDGDCIGFLSWTLYLYCGTVSRETGNTIIRTGTGKVSFLKYADQITQKKESTEPYDLFFSLDCSDTERLHEFKKYFEEAILQYKKLHFVEQEVEITIDPSKLQQDEEECWRATEELYIILKKKMPIRINTKLTEMKTNDLKINQQKENIKVGTALDVNFYKKKRVLLMGRDC